MQRLIKELKDLESKIKQKSLTSQPIYNHSQVVNSLKSEQPKQDQVPGKNGICYHCEARRANAKGNVPSCINCIPAHFNLLWDFTEHNKRDGLRSGPNSKMHAVIEEKYSRCLEVEFKTPARKKVLFMSIDGPIQSGKGLAIPKIKHISATFGIYGNKTFGGTKFSTASTRNPDNFTVYPIKESDGFTFNYQMSPLLNHGEITMPAVKPRKNVIAPKGWYLLEPDKWGAGWEGGDVEVLLDKILKHEDIVKSLRLGKKIEMKVPYHFIFRTPGTGPTKIIDGTVSLKISLKKQPTLKVTPNDGFTIVGPDENGKFNPESKTYTLSNSSESPLAFIVNKTKPWLNILPASGTLAPGGKTKVTVSVKNLAKKLKEGSYKDQINFVNETNGKGNTSRPVNLDIGEIQIWNVKMTGQETDDMGGNLMRLKMNDVWQDITVDYGIRFDYVINARFVLKKKKGVWKFSHGQIINAVVKYSSNFDPTVFFIKKMKCVNCKKITDLAGYTFGGEVDGKTVRLIWPNAVPRVVVTNKLNLKFKSKQKSHQGWSDNFFMSAEFLDRARQFWIPLKNGHHPEKVIKESSKDRFRLDKRPQISISYYFYMQRIK